MLNRLDLRGAGLDRDLRGVLPRAVIDVQSTVETVRPTCDDVRARGDAAVLDATERFDGVRPESLRVPATALKAALEKLDPAVRDALEEAIRRTRLVHEAQRRSRRQRRGRAGQPGDRALGAGPPRRACTCRAAGSPIRAAS